MDRQGSIDVDAVADPLSLEWKGHWATMPPEGERPFGVDVDDLARAGEALDVDGVGEGEVTVRVRRSVHDLIVEDHVAPRLITLDRPHVDRELRRGDRGPDDG